MQSLAAESSRENTAGYDALAVGRGVYAYANGDPVDEVDPLGLDGWGGLSGGVTAEEAQAEAAQAEGEAETATNVVVGAGGTVAVGRSGGEYSSGGYYNFYTGQGGGFTSGGNSITSSGQEGFGGMLGEYVGAIVGPASSVGGPFENRNLGIPWTPISITEYINSNGEPVGGAIGIGIGGGYTQTNTVTAQYPTPCP